MTGADGAELYGRVVNIEYRYRYYRRYFRIKVSIAVSTILCWPFLSTLHRYFSTDMQSDAHNFLSFRAFVRVQRSVEILDERRITCNKIYAVTIDPVTVEIANWLLIRQPEL